MGLAGEPEPKRSVERDAEGGSGKSASRGPPQSGYVGPFGVHAPTAGFGVGVGMILWALVGLSGGVKLSSPTVGIIVLVLGFVLVALTTTPLGRLAFKALGVEVEVERRNGKPP